MAKFRDQLHLELSKPLNFFQLCLILVLGIYPNLLGFLFGLSDDEFSLSLGLPFYVFGSFLCDDECVLKLLLNGLIKLAAVPANAPAPL